MHRLLLVLLLLSQSIYASALPTPRFHVSATGRHVLALTAHESGGIGTCYELSDDGSLLPKWSVSGWYAFRVLLGADGHTLIRIGGSGDEGPRFPDDIVVLAFYDDGVLKRRFTIADVEAILGKSLRDVHAGSDFTGQSFEGEVVGSFLGLNRGEEFTWRLIDGSTICFDLSGAVKWVDVSGKSKAEAAEPGATDNPDDARRLREDH